LRGDVVDLARQHAGIDDERVPARGRDERVHRVAAARADADAVRDVRPGAHGSVGGRMWPATISFSSESTVAFTGGGISAWLRSSYTQVTPWSASPKSRMPPRHRP